MQRLFLWLALLMAPVPAVAQSAGDLDAQLRQLLRRLPGEYDNNAQIARQSAGGTIAPVHSLFRAVTAPQFGPHIVYLEEFKNNDPKQITRIRLYTFAVDATKSAIRMKLINPVDQKTLIGTNGDFGAIARLKEKDARPDRDNCIVWLRWVGGQFEGSMTPRTCDAGPNWIDYRLVIGPSYHWVNAKVRALKDDSLVSESTPGETWLEQGKLGERH